MHIHLDPLGGVAGDMFVAAVLDAFPELVGGLLATLRALEVPRGSNVAVHDHIDSTFVGRRFVVTGVEVADPGVRQHGDASGDNHHAAKAGSGTLTNRHCHRAFREIRSYLASAPLTEAVREHALGIFSLLADAEGKIHGVAPDEVTFHEVGAWDSIIDIVASAHLIDTLKVDRWSLSALPTGSGRVTSSHGILPVPAPATLLLLEGFRVFDDGIAGERVTPTGAAIVRYLSPDFTGRMEPSTLTRTGIGFGARIMPGVSNILRVIVFESPESAINEETLGVIEFEIDDQTPEDLAIALERLRGSSGVRDVLQTAACGKKGRIVASIRILVDPDAVRGIVRACFIETTTLGVRTSSTRRVLLERSNVVADIDSQAIGVKLAHRPDGSVTAKAEAADVQQAGDRRAREVLKLRAEKHALQRKRSD